MLSQARNVTKCTSNTLYLESCSQSLMFNKTSNTTANFQEWRSIVRLMRLAGFFRIVHQAQRLNHEAVVVMKKFKSQKLPDYYISYLN